MYYYNHSSLVALPPAAPSPKIHKRKWLNQMIQAGPCDELCRGEAKLTHDTHTHRQTWSGNDNNRSLKLASFKNLDNLSGIDFTKKFVLCPVTDQFEFKTTNTPFTQGLRLLCLPCATNHLSRSPLKAQRRPNGCLGRSRVVYRTFILRLGRHGRREILCMFKKVVQRSSRRSVTHRSLKGGSRTAHASPWSQNGCTVVGHWSPRKKCVLL